MSTQAVIKKARNIQRSLGTRAAAGFIRNQGYSVNFAVFWLRGL